MKVLWFNLSTPKNYNSTSTLLGGWQDSLEEIVRNEGNIQLYIAFKQ